MPDTTKQLLAKTTKTLSESLKESMDQNLVYEQYMPLQSKQDGETIEEYARRVIEYAIRPQFVKVIFEGTERYIYFGTPGPIITPYGKFEFIPAEVIDGMWGVHYFLFSPSLMEIQRSKQVFVRMDSGCVSGHVFGDITCDCPQQLDASMHLCAERGGIIINIPSHDGRGWGEYKMANQMLMNACGVDTVTAARLVYGNDAFIDRRTYTEAAIILKAFGFDETYNFDLATNNPSKVKAFESLGLKIGNVESIVAESGNNALLQRNLDAKKTQWHHKINGV